MQDDSYKNIVFLSKLAVLHALSNRKYSKKCLARVMQGIPI